MITVPKPRVRIVHLRCRFCDNYHFNTRNQGIAFVPLRIQSEGTIPTVPRTYRNIPHAERPAYGRNLPAGVLARLRNAAHRAAYEQGVLEPYRAFEYQSSNSVSMD